MDHAARTAGICRGSRHLRARGAQRDGGGGFAPEEQRLVHRRHAAAAPHALRKNAGGLVALGAYPAGRGAGIDHDHATGAACPVQAAIAQVDRAQGGAAFARKNLDHAGDLLDDLGGGIARGCLHRVLQVLAAGRAAPAAAAHALRHDAGRTIAPGRDDACVAHDARIGRAAAARPARAAAAAGLVGDADLRQRQGVYLRDRRFGGMYQRIEAGEQARGPARVDHPGVAAAAADALRNDAGRVIAPRCDGAVVAHAERAGSAACAAAAPRRDAD